MNKRETTTELLEAARAGNETAISQPLAMHEQRLKLMVRARLDQRIRHRVDEDDIVQDTLIEATKKLGEYGEDPQTSFFAWLRGIARNRHLNGGEGESNEANKHYDVNGDTIVAPSDVLVIINYLNRLLSSAEENSVESSEGESSNVSFNFARQAIENTFSSREENSEAAEGEPTSFNVVDVPGMEWEQRPFWDHQVESRKSNHLDLQPDSIIDEIAGEVGEQYDEWE